MQYYSVENIPYNELFAAATPVSNESYLYSDSSESSIFIYKISGSGITSNVTLTFSSSYNGSIEIYNGREILKVNLNITEGVVTEQQYNGYEVLYPGFFNENYSQTLNTPNARAVEFLNYINGSATSPSSNYQITSTVYDEQSIYVLLSATPAEFAAYVSIVPAETVELTLPASVPENIDASTPINLDNIQGEYTLKISENFLKQIQDAPVKLTVGGITNKVMKVELRYGNMSIASDYRYNQNTYFGNEQSLYKELIAATGDDNVVAFPFAVDTNESNVNLVDLNVVGDVKAEASVYIKAPLPDTTINLQLKINLVSADSAAVHNDPYTFHARPDENGSSVYNRLRHLGYC